MSGNPSTSSGSGRTGDFAGSGGGAGGPSGPGGGDAGHSCDLEFDTVLGSPEPDQVAVLSVGEVLVIALTESPPAVFATTASGDRVGGILQLATELRDCIQRGFRYEAEVLEIDGGAVRVRVHLATT